MKHRRLVVFAAVLVIFAGLFVVRLAVVKRATPIGQNASLPADLTSADAALAQTVSPDPPGKEWQASAESYVYLPTENPRLYVSGKSGAPLTVSLFPINLKRWLEGDYSVKGVKPVAVLRDRLPRSAQSYNISKSVKLPPQKAGAYAALVQGGTGVGDSQRLLLLVSNVGLVVKSTPSQELWVQAIRLDNGAPVADCRLDIQQGTQNTQGVTDASGMYKTPLLPKSLPKVLGTRGANVALCYAPESGGGPSRYPIFFQTDRPVYKPDQVAYFKGVARENTGSGYKTLARESVEVEIKTPDEGTLSKQTLTTNEFGSFSGEVKIPDGAALGEYPVKLKMRGEETTDSIVLAEYRKPEFKAAVKPTKAVTLVGESFSADVDAQYYFGAPVAGAEVRYYVYSRPDYVSLNQDAGDAEGDFPGVGGASSDEESGYGEMIADGTVLTGAAGTARITIPTRKEATPTQYVVECTLQDASRQSVRASGGASVLPSALLTEATPERYGAAPGEKVAVALATADGKTKKPLAAPVTVVVERRRWEKVTRADKTVRWKESATTVLKTVARTNAEGKGRFVFTPTKSGDYRIRASVTDNQKRRMEAESSVWVYGGAENVQEGNFESVELLPDKKRYAPGDTAKILVRTNAPNSDVWLTIEGRKVQESRHIKLKGNSQVVSLPLSDTYTPGVYVSASYVKNKQFLRREVLLPITPRAHLLHVAITPDKPQYEPGETARYTVRATDYTGKPVSAEVAVGVVDASVYAVRSDRTQDIRKFFWSPGSNGVATAFSFASQYAGGPPKEARMMQGFAPAAKKKALRVNFKDTAFWTPAVVTDGSGAATVSVEMPDNLTTWRTTARAVTQDTSVGWNTHDVISRRNLIARLATPRFLTQGDQVTISGVIHNYTNAPVNAVVTLKAEGAGLAMNSNGQQRTITLAPNADKRLDWPVRAGLPGMTTLTLEADAGTDNDGMALSLATLPRGVPATVASSGALAPSGITKTFTLPSGRTAFRDDLRVMVAPSLVSAALGSADDLAAYPYGCIEQTLSRFVPNLVLENLLKERNAASPKRDELPKMARAGLARVYEMQNEQGGWAFARTETDPYFTAIAVEALVLAKQSGYEVNGRVIARGATALRKSVGSLNVDAPRPPKRGWKKGQRENALYAMRHNLHDKARGLLALALVEPAATKSAIGRLWNRKSELDSVGVAFLTRGAVLAGDKTIAAQGAALLKKQARNTATGTYWPAPNSYSYLEQDTFATAEAVRALLAVDKNDTTVPSTFRWLMAQRRGRSWHSTNDSASVLYAVADFERAHPEAGDAINGAKVVVNGKTVQEVKFAPGDRFKPETIIMLDPALLRAGSNSVQVLPTGNAKSPVYYALALRYFQPTPPAGITQPVVAGIRVERTYLKRVPKTKPRVGPSRDGEDFDYWGDDNWSLVPFGGQAKPGDEIVVKLVVTTDSDVGYVLIEDPYPSGCEPVNQVDADNYGDAYDETGTWGRRETHSDRIAFLGERLSKGKTVIQYRLRATTPGAFGASGARAFAMYVPEVRGSAKSATMFITDPAKSKPSTARRIVRR